MTARVKIYLIGRALWRKYVRKLINKLKPALPTLNAVQELKVSERVIEYPFIFENLRHVKTGGRILDVGYRGSPLIAEIAVFDYECHAIDIRNPFKYAGINIVRGSICNAPYREGVFDVITAVSTIEHIGLSEPYGDVEKRGTDKTALNEIKRILKPDGKILITLPYGKVVPWTYYRAYDGPSLRRMLSGLKIEVDKYFIRDENNRTWLQSTRAQVERVYSSDVTNAVVLLRLSKTHAR